MFAPAWTRNLHDAANRHIELLVEEHQTLQLHLKLRFILSFEVQRTGPVIFKRRLGATASFRDV